MTEPKLGSYGIVSTHGLIGFLIQLGTFSKMNHAFIYVGNGQIIEATPRKGVKISPVTNYQNIAWNHQEALTDPQREDIVRTALAHLGDPYFFRTFVVIGLRILRIPTPKWLTGDLSKSKGVICSELVAKCYRANGLNIVKGKPDYFVTPSDLTYRLLYIGG